MSELKPTTEESIRHFETQQKRYVREHNGKLCPHYANAIEALRRAQPANEPLTKISEMLEQAAQDMDDKCRQWQCVLQRVHGAGTFDQNSGLWVGIDKAREAKAQASFEAYRYALEVIDKIAEHVSNPYKSAHKQGGEQE